ncbi:MAG: type IV pilus biogenesis/stability protein PilW [Gammaproteobacteria bacterium]|nr:type IV pilus biogenesis/stability protein PilW [Gammaproteobacteria bacterium]
MRSKILRALLPIMLGSLVITGCATQGPVGGSDDTTGDLGAEQRESPAAIYVQMGIAYLREGQPAVALKKLKKAISIDPQYAEAYNVTAILYERLGETQLADEHYTKAVSLKPRDPYIRNARGSFYCKQEEYEQAQAEFDSALNNPLYPTPWVAMTNAGLCAERSGDLETAERRYREALTAKDDYFQALYQMAKIAFKQHNYLSARAYLERYNGVAQATAGSLWLGVQIERNLGDRHKARTYSQELLEKFPDAPEVQSLHQAGW